MTVNLKAIICVSDDGESKSNNMRIFCNEHAIKQKFACPYTPEHNAPIERLFRTLNMMCNTMLQEKHMKEEMWQYAHNQQETLIHTAAKRLRNVLMELNHPSNMFEYSVQKHTYIFHMNNRPRCMAQRQLKEH